MAAYFSLDDQGVVEGAVHDGRMNQILTDFAAMFEIRPQTTVIITLLMNPRIGRKKQISLPSLASKKHVMEFYPLSE